MNTQQNGNQKTNAIANSMKAFATKRGMPTTIRATQNPGRRALVPVEEECVNDHTREFLYSPRSMDAVPTLARA